MMIKIKLALLAIMIASHTLATTIQDSDLDGVPDRLDQCPHTPFLNEVNQQGCTTNILTLPQDSERDSLILALGYGYFTNEDLEDRERQYITRAQLAYYHDNWSYTLQTGYYTHQQDRGMQDTILKIKKWFSPKKNTKISAGIGIKLPSYDFKGNKTDYTLYSALTHYTSIKHSYFAGVNYTFVQDTPRLTPLQNSYNLYIGSGYFLRHDFYASLSYSFAQSKFSDEHSIHTLSSMIYYKINKTFFTTLSYQREIGDEDLHDGLILKIGAKMW